METLVLGIGNTLLTDEGVGVHSGNVFFEAPTAAFSDSSISYQDVETREYIYIFIGQVFVP